MFDFYKNLKTIQKLTVLVLFLSLFIAGIGYTGYYYNQKTNDSLEIMYQYNLQPIQWINTLRINLNAARANVLEIAITSDKNTGR